MFSFHKPKVYRSSTGCCICRAKSSSSRFTDSKKYEDDFTDCFQLHEPRSGEICNACVLLVKRWKKLPPGSERNWRHVVDARAGPGTKSLSKFKSKNKRKLKLKTDSLQKIEKLMKKKHIYLKSESISMSIGSYPLSPEINGENCSSDVSDNHTSIITSSPTSSEKSFSVKKHSKSTPQCVQNRKRHLSPTISSFLDMTFWKRQKICCGTIFKGPYGEVIVDPRFLKPCTGCIKSRDQLNDTIITPAETDIGLEDNKPVNKDVTSNKILKTYSDSSSDSGYDESSNQGSLEGASQKRILNGDIRRNIIQPESNPLAEFAVHATSLCQHEVGHVNN